MSRAPMLLLLLLSACVDADRVEQRDAFEFCGDAPCGWTLEAGKVEPGPTWHTRATGLSLVTQGTRIQRTFVGLRCLNLHYRADFQAPVHLSFDTNGDGRQDFEEPMRGRAFSEVRRSYRIPAAVSEVSIVLEKTGEGRAVLGELEWEGWYADPCPDRAQELPHAAPPGEPCDAGATCPDAP